MPRRHDLPLPRDGSSFARALLPQGVGGEYASIEHTYRGPARVLQKLAHHGGRQHDVLTLELTSGEWRDVFFDVTICSRRVEAAVRQCLSSMTGGDNEGSMFYWFQRGKDLLRYEARTMLDAYELVIVAPDGTERVERFGNSAALQKREADLLGQLQREGWQGPHGWNL